MCLHLPLASLITLYTLDMFLTPCLLQSMLAMQKRVVSLEDHQHKRAREDEVFMGTTWDIVDQLQLRRATVQNHTGLIRNELVAAADKQSSEGKEIYRKITNTLDRMMDAQASEDEALETAKTLVRKRQATLAERARVESSHPGLLCQM